MKWLFAVAILVAVVLGVWLVQHYSRFPAQLASAATAAVGQNQVSVSGGTEAVICAGAENTPAAAVADTESISVFSIETVAADPLRRAAPFWLFIGGILLLGIGYFTYGKYIENLLRPDERTTPAIANYDGVDFVELPHWKNMLIQLLNIAGVGPVVGVILGIRFGAIAFLIIPVGNIIGGAVHDFLSGMMSLRHNGANLPILIKRTLGKYYFHFFSVFTIALLLLVVAVFINVPATLLDSFFFPGVPFFWYAVGGIFLYYILATLFPIDKIIGAVYPLFGLMLLLGSAAILVMLIVSGIQMPELFAESAAFQARVWNAANDHPVVPLLFVTIACGIISGFHATQSPIVARTMSSERQARSTYYGMMIVEGVIGMIWAGAGLVVYNLFPDYFTMNPNKVLVNIVTFFLGDNFGGVTILAVVILAVTSGDTAMRSMRLSLAEIFGIDQKKLIKRLLLCLPLIVIVAGLLAWSNTDAQSFNNLWNYFAWGNQVLAASTLFGMAVWLKSMKKCSLPALLPGIFMAFVVLSFILWTSPSHPRGGPWGLGLDINTAYWIGGALTLLLTAFVGYRGRLAAAEADAQLKK